MHDFFRDFEPCYIPSKFHQNQITRLGGDSFAHIKWTASKEWSDLCTEHKIVKSSIFFDVFGLVLAVFSTPISPGLQNQYLFVEKYWYVDLLMLKNKYLNIDLLICWNENQQKNIDFENDQQINKKTFVENPTFLQKIQQKSTNLQRNPKNIKKCCDLSLKNFR